MVADAISEKIGAEVDRHRVESQPLRDGRAYGEDPPDLDLIPEVKVIIENEEELEGEEDTRKPASAPSKLPRSRESRSGISGRRRNSRSR